MIYIGVCIFLGTLLVAGWMLSSLLPGTQEEADKANFRSPIRTPVRIVCVLVFGLIFLVFTLASTIRTVLAGHVGLVYTFGNITGQREAGFNLVFPWQGFKTATIQVQTLCFMDENDSNKCPEGSRKIGAGLDSFSKETQNVYIDAIVNIEVSPTEVQDLYRRVGPEYVSKLIPGRVAQIFKDETVNYGSVNLAPSRETIRKNVEEALRTEMQPYSIDVVALLVENIQFDAEFESAALQKQVAGQEAEKQQALVAAREAEARQQAAAAQGVADKLRIEANGQAEANRAITSSLSPILVQWQAIQKLASDIKIALILSGQGLLIDPTTLFGTTPEEQP